MASKPPSQPGAPAPHSTSQKPHSTSQKKVRFSPTALAIAGSMLVALIGASLITKDPVTAFRMAYTNYAGEVPASILTEGKAPEAIANPGENRGSPGGASESAKESAK